MTLGRVLRRTNIIMLDATWQDCRRQNAFSDILDFLAKRHFDCQKIV